MSLLLYYKLYNYIIKSIVETHILISIHTHKLW